MTDHNSSSKPKFTLDEFINYTDFLSLTLAPDNNELILIQTKHRIWDQNINEYRLYLQSLNSQNRKLVTCNVMDSPKPLWQGEWIVYVARNTLNNAANEQQVYMNIYSTRTEQTFPIAVRKEPIHAFTWSNTNTCLYFASQTQLSNEYYKAYKEQWNDVIEYRDNERGDTIYRIDITDLSRVQIEPVINISLRVLELICAPDGKHLVFSTGAPSQQTESMDDYEIFSYDLTSSSPPKPVLLMKNHVSEQNLKRLNNDTILFTVEGDVSNESGYHENQERLYSLNITNGHVDRWADQFSGTVKDFALLEEGRKGVIILGQLNTEIQIYTQESIHHPLIKRTGWSGTYENIVTNFVNNKSTIAFIHSSFEAPQEIYFTNTIDHLTSAKKVTNENKLFTERNLPKGTKYRWTNKDDGTEIEGILLYPPDQYQEKNLPLLVLMHGGPYSANLNVFHVGGLDIALMMATEGWLVFQPNYRGSTGYGDEFLQGVFNELFSRPGKDVLFGVDALIQDGIVDPKRLTIGGYSYGGHLTNWLITQTTRFNAAVTGAGCVDHVSSWGITDLPLFRSHKIGGLPWQAPDRYQQEAAIFQLHKVRTPTHMVTGENDCRVPTAQSYLLKRALHILGIPSKLIVFPGEGHLIKNNPWHEKIKVREELKWLNKYGGICLLECDEASTLS
ncbi:unnamed protein product, partial [Adineta steineri]